MIGLHIMRPTSIVVAGGGSETASVRADGGVDFASATSLSLNGVFTADYDDYMISIRGVETTNNNLAIRMRASGTDATGTNYTYQQLFGSSTTVSSQRLTTQSSAWSGYISSAQRSGDTIWVYGPNLAQSTAGRNVSAAGLSSGAIVDYAWTHAVSTSYDGITFLGMTSMSGMVTVYGYAQ